MDASLLPNNSMAVERAIAMAMAIPDALSIAAGTMTPAKLVSPPPSYLPFLIEEYGLGELTPYVPSLYDLIREGVRWQRIRGTPAALDMGLSWLGYTAELEEASPERRFWNSFQLRFSTLPPRDDPDLERIEGIASLSVPRRSKLRRGVFQYDVRALVADNARLDNSMLDFSSGIRVTDGTIVFPEGAIWSFGRTTELSHTLTETEGLAIGNWIPLIENGSAPWRSMHFPWVDYVAPWASTPEEQRRANMAGWFAEKIIYLVLRDADGGIIGYRRCRVVRPIRQQFGGEYSFGGAAYEPVLAGTSVYIEAMTQFEDTDRVEAKQISLLVGAGRAAGIPPGRLWLRPGDLSGGSEFAAISISVPLRKTVRDQFKIMLRF